MAPGEGRIDHTCDINFRIDSAVLRMLRKHKDTAGNGAFAFLEADAEVNHRKNAKDRNGSPLKKTNGFNSS